MNARLRDARAMLLYRQKMLHAVRSSRMLGEHYDSTLKLATQSFNRALDRVWELQCMCEGRL